jgi:hypothetical protein
VQIIDTTLKAPCINHVRCAGSVTIAGPGAAPTLLELDPLTDHRYTGLNGNGDWICQLCWCPACQMHHLDSDERERCEMGVENDEPACDGDHLEFRWAVTRR